MEQKIVLDKESFKALSAGSRVGILKALRERRKTLSELSQTLSLGASTVKEHCDILKSAGLITLIDEGRKWKYYELTKKGRQIVAPGVYEGVQVLVMLCIGALAFSAFLFVLLQSQTLPNGSILGAGTDLTTGMAAVSEEKALSTNAVPETQISIPQENGNALLISKIIAASLVAGLLIGWLARGKK